MTVQEYLKNKKINILGLPKMYVVKSTPEGVEKPIERQVVEIKEGIGWERIDDDEKYRLDRYILDETSYPYEVDLTEGKSNLNEGYGSGFGDLWAWSYFCTLSPEEAEKYYTEETKRVQTKYKLIQNTNDKINN